ncbi:MAG TPA: hypothetical protein VKM93_10840 [Terriglobia bacterium]|nr:hypothetical protein [Terriglobia bacterium]
MIYTAAGGLGAVGGYTFPTTSNIPTPIACTLASPTLTCATTPGNPITQAPATYHPTVTAVDVANAATPAANTTSDPASIRPNTDTLNVRPEISFTPPGSAPDAVNGKSYGTDGSTFGLTGCTPGPVCATLNYVINNGLGNYIDPGTLATAGPVAFATCHFAVPHTPGVLTDTYKCSTSSVSQGAGGYALTMSASDTGNAAAPGVTKSDSAAVPLTVHSALSLAVTNPPGVTTTFPDGVVHRDYGVTTDTCALGLNSCVPITYTASNGLSGVGVTFTASGTSNIPGANFPTGFACPALAVNPLKCSASPIGSGVTPGSFTPSVGVTDAGNLSTPTSSQTINNISLLVHAELTLGVNLSLPLPDGVPGRDYAVTTDTCASSSPCVPLKYTATTGLANSYTITPSAGTFPTGFHFPCTVSTASVPNDTLSCSAAPISAAAATGPYTPTVGATDTANATTPAATPGTDPASQRTTDSLTLDPEIVIQNASNLQLPNGQLNQPYSVLFTCQNPLVTGTCGGTGSPDNAAAVYTWSASSNTITGVGSSFPVAPPTPTPPLQPTYAAIFSGTPTVAGSGENVTVGIRDNGNSTTPSCVTASTCPTSPTFSANILTSDAYVGANGSNSVDVFGTSTGAPVFGSTITPGGGATPNYAAASTNGTDMFVADPGANQVYIINTPSAVITKTVTHLLGLSNTAGDTAAVAVGPQAIPTLGTSPDDVYAYVANAGTDDVQIVDANPSSVNFGTTTGTGGPITFTGGPYVGTGASDLKVAPTFFVGGVRKTHAYVVRPGGDEVCVFDAEPSSGTFKSQITPTTHNADNCIALASAFGAAKFIDVSPDGLYAFVTVTDGTTHGYLKIIDTDPNSGTFETLLHTFDLTTLATPCTIPAGVRVSPDGQTIWVACHETATNSQLVPFSTALVNTTQFNALTAIPTPSPTTDFPIGMAFRPDGALGLATLSGTNFLLPFTPPTTAGTEVATTGVTTPFGLDHIPNAVLHITTTALPAATNSVAYKSSIVAAGPNRYYTFTDITPASPGPTLAALGLTLSPDGEVSGTPLAAFSGTTNSLVIQVTDQSQPVNNVVVQTITLHVN